MKKAISFYCIILTLICQVFALVAPVNAAGNANSFYFSDAKFDYTLGKDTEGVSTLKVKETLTAEFPSTNQNHGITRYIPYTNQGGKNVTLKNLDSLKVSRNGQPENIAKTERENGCFAIYLGNENEYVHGTQTYILEYEFKNVITDFSDFQELYWDTNGTGWSQRFERLTATLHLDNSVKAALKSETWCYVGYHGAKGQDRCEMVKKSDMELTFSTTNLAAGENLTFVAQFAPETFVVVHEYNYLLVILAVILSIGAFFAIFGTYRYWLKKAKAKYLYRKNLFLTPQYQPMKDLTVAEAAKVAIKTTKPSYVATLLEMAIAGKVTLKQAEPTKTLKKDTWIVIVNNVAGLTPAQKYVLEILNGGTAVKDGMEIAVKKHTASSHLQSLTRLYASSSGDRLVEKGFLTKNTSKTSSAATVAVAIVIALCACFAPAILSFGAVILGEMGAFAGDLVGSAFLIPYLVALVLATIVITCVFAARSSKYSTYTEKGLDADNYLEGLKLYIKMAEKDRLKFLQSVKGAPKDDKGIVKLYEKLLPYACLFGLEDSWMGTLNRYYQMDPAYQPGWYYGHSIITISAFNSINHSLSTTIASSTSYSSSSSGGGGGGFSGGGGGGGW
ncbi:DUF2207 domain-containing protein [Candidatus Saccharibacteria bacterium]|nr:DUF2207 domain-containing protein [Candidatus Saccharibacteria bacterium]